MEKNYRVSVDVVSTYFTKELNAIGYAKELDRQDSDRMIKVYSTKFNVLIYQN